MPRISIEISPEEHQRLKAFAALRGQSIKEYVLEQTLPPIANQDASEAQALQELEAFLKPRIEAAERGEASSRTVTQIFEDARNRAAH
jgi:uncharacterized protein (DUF1778 family)